MFRDFRDGIASYLRAWSVVSDLGLWNKLMVPGGISLLLFGLLGYMAYHLAGPLGVWLANFWPFGWGESYVDWVAAFVGGAAVFFVGLTLYKNIVLVILSPFLSAISERVEAQALGVTRPYSGLQAASAWRAVSRGILMSISLITRELWYTFWLLLLSLIPVIGLAAAAALFLVQAYFAGFGNMDFTLERYYGTADSRDFVKRHSALAIGNGSAFLLLLMVPVVGIFLAPTLATVAATLETVKRISDKPKEVHQGNQFV